MRGKIQEFNFRQLNHSYIMIVNPSTNVLKAVKGQFKSEAKDNAILAYGYIDNMAGLSFEVLCMAYYREDGGVELREGNIQTSFKLRYDSINGMVINMMPNVHFLPFYKKVDSINQGYTCSKLIEEYRKIDGIDTFRHPQFPDDLLVYFVKDGLKTEQIWVHITGIMDGNLAGTLLNEPYGEFGIHKGERVGIIPMQGDGVLLPVAVL